MCVIAGYSGTKRAAPILIDMIQKTEHTDGGFSTGIVTIHEGKLYIRKVLGDLEVLLRETDALDLPGTTGIIHSRTDNSHIEHAHPFLSGDGNLALVTNGTSRGTCNKVFYEAQNAKMDELYDKGIPVRTAVFKASEHPNYPGVLKNGNCYLDAEPYALIIGDKVANSKEENLREDLVWATKEALEEFPRDVITINVHAKVPDTITIGTVSRSVAIGMGDDGTYFCTSPFGLPKEVADASLYFVQPTSVLQVTPKGFELRATSLKGTRVEQIDYRTAKEIRLNIEKYLKVGEENAISIYGLPFFTEWNEFWRAPAVDSKYVLEGTFLKPIAPAIYEGLWSFYKEGRLKVKIGTRINSKGQPRKQVQFWLDH